MFSFTLLYCFLSSVSSFVFLNLTPLPLSPFSLAFSSSSSLYHPSLYGRKRERERERRLEIDVGPAHTETGSWLNRSDRSGTEHLLCQTAVPLWMEIISKLLQEADACQKILSVKVRLLRCCLAFSLSLCHTFTFFIFSHQCLTISFSPARVFL